MNAPADFERTVVERTGAPLARAATTTLQINVGKRCNQACHHCHVDAGPKRTEQMDESTAERILELLAATPGIECVDVTGGAPELNPSFARLVRGARALGKRVMDRCNLTILFEPGQEGLVDLLVDERVELVCSLPCYTADNVDAQRGRGVFEKSIAALRILNERGYGQPGSALRLDLVYNPGGPFLPPAQAALAERYHAQLEDGFGVRFHELLTLANMPISRFAEDLERQGRFAEYQSLLVNHFNPATVPGLMCRSLVSVGYDGTLHDCDFNQMLEMPLTSGDGRALTLRDIESFASLEGRAVRTGAHCFGCTAGAGSSCGGALA